MSFILIISILIRIIAIVWSVALWRQLRDWRMVFLTLMLALMALRQSLTLYKNFEGWFISVVGYSDEFPGLVVSVLALIIVIIFQKIIIEKQEQDKSLSKNEERLNQVLEGFQDGHWDWNIITNEQWWSNNFYHLLGYKEREIEPTYENFIKLIHPDDINRAEKRIKAHLEDRVPYENEYRLQMKTGEYNWFRGRGQAVWNEDGKLTRFSGSIQNITQLKEAENKLQESEERTRKILDSMSTFVGLFSIDGILLDANSEPIDRASLTREDVIGKPFAETYWWSYSSVVQERIRTNLAKVARGETIRYDELVRMGEDKFITIDINIAPLYDNKGNVVQLIGSAVDITGRKEMEESLIKSEEKYRSVLDITNEWIWEIDLEGNHIYSNDSIEYLLGYKADEIIGKDAFEIISYEARADIREKLSGFVKNKIGWTGLVVPWIHKSGDVRYFESNASPIFDSNNELTGYRGADRDITKRIKTEKELRFTQFAIDHLNDAAFWIGDEGQFVYVNEAACESLGYSKKELLNMHVYDIDPGFEKEKWENYWKNTEAQYFTTFETQHQRKDGTVFPVEIASNHLEFEGKHFRCTFARNIQERKWSETLMQASEERYRTLYDNNPSMFFTIDKNLKVVSVNNFGAEQLGYKADQLIGNQVLDVFIDDDKNKANEYLQACFSEPEELHRWELRKERKDGSILWVRETARCVIDKINSPSIFIVCEDISETHLLSEQLTYQASHDALTGLINRREFENRLIRIIETSHTSGTEHVLCYLDLDQFKIINDTCGHFAGDDLLNQVSQLIQKHIRKRDTLARLGGDEFGILMEHCNMIQAENVANSILKEIEVFRYLWEGNIFTIGVSMGLVMINKNVTGHIEILRMADAACYAAKDAGRNRIHIYSENDKGLAQRHGEMEWVNRISRALEEDNFELFIQPIVAINANNDDVFQYEILIRMKKDDDTAPILPGVFLPAAERYNLASRIDKWVVNAVFAFFDEHSALLSRFELCSINLSGQSLADRDFLNFVIDKVNQYGDIGEKICFEITETAAISNIQTAARFIHTLKELGCQFSLDDFGSGLSSFAYLKTLPVDYLKIDGLFVRDIVEDEADYAMVKSINEISQVMGIKSIAEFVENKKIKQKLVDIGVDYIQGYGIGKPMPLKNLLK
jgi:diguanylate cyclase (GGDEF)-like protein/PAS domain S-box-containing protein